MSQAVVTNYFAKKRRGGCIQPSKRLKLAEDVQAVEKARVLSSFDTDRLVVAPDKAVEEIRKARAQASSRKKQASQPRRSKRNVKKTLPEPTLPSLDEYFSQDLGTSTSLDDLTLRLSPSSSKSSLCGSEKDAREVVTAADDDHDVPASPSKRQKKSEKEAKQQKRNRVSPKKKLSYEFKNTPKSREEKLSPDTEFASMRPRRRNARRILSSSDEESSSGAEEAKQKPTNQATEYSKTADPDEPLQDQAVPPVQEEKNSEKVKEKQAEKDADQENTAPTTRRTRSRKNAVSGDQRQKDQAATMKKSRNLAEKLLAKKTDSPASMKEKLKGSTKLKDLQETLMKMKEQKKKQQEKEKSKKQIKKQEQKEATKETKSTEKRQFAYETLHSLAQEVPKGLPLPFKYKILAEMFRCTDTVVSMLFNRQQVTTWTNLQKSVKEMIRKNFELDNLGQIKTVFPSAYQLRQEKGILSYSDHIRPSDYQLTLEPILDEKECDQFGEGARKLTSSMLVKRRHHFLVQLIEVVKEHHKRFLSTLDPPVEIPEEKILRWHPQFPLDRVPDLEVAELPKPPDHDKDKCHSAKDVLDKARFKFTKKARDALKKVAESMTPEKSPKTSSPVIEENNNLTPATPTTPKAAPALKGVSQSLLAKIRAKEAEKKKRTMIRSERDDDRLQKISKLPDVARALRMLFVTEKKAALQLDYICDKLVRCTTGILSPGIVREHILLLLESMPSWVTKAVVRNVTYLRMNKNKEMSEIIGELQARIKEAEMA